MKGSRLPVHTVGLAAIVAWALLGCGRLGYDAELEGDAGVPAGDAGPGDAVDSPLCALAGWSYDQPLVLHNDGKTALTDYQIHVVVDTQSRISAGKMAADCGDVAFVVGAATAPHWLESGCGTPATSFWVRVPSIPIGTTSVHLRYGAGAGVATSDGRAVFLMFDDFDDGEMADWSTYAKNLDAGDGAYSGTVTAADSVSPADSLELSADAACFLAPFDGLVAGARKPTDLPAGDYSIDFQAHGAVLDFRFNTSGTSNGRVGTDAGILAAVSLASCAGLGCTASGDWRLFQIPVAQQAIPALTLELDASDCVTGAGWFDDVRIRRRSSPEPQLDLGAAEATCP